MANWRQPPSIRNERRLGQLYDRAPKWLWFEIALDYLTGVEQPEKIENLESALEEKVREIGNANDWNGQL